MTEKYRKCLAGESLLLEMIAMAGGITYEEILQSLVEESDHNAVIHELQDWWGDTLPGVMDRLHMLEFIRLAANTGYEITPGGEKYLALAKREAGDCWVRLKIGDSK